MYIEVCIKLPRMSTQLGTQAEQITHSLNRRVHDSTTVPTAETMKLDSNLQKPFGNCHVTYGIDRSPRLRTNVLCHPIAVGKRMLWRWSINTHTLLHILQKLVWLAMDVNSVSKWL